MTDRIMETSSLPNTTAETPAQIWMENTVGMALLEYGFPIIIFSGTLGNVMALVVLLRHRMRGTSVCFYLAMLAVADTFVLYLSAFKSWLRMLTGFEILHMSSAACKIILFLLLIMWHMSAWLVVAMTVDRFVAVWLPLKAAIICNVVKARLVTVAMFLVMIGINIHALWTMHLELSPHSSCKAADNNYFMANVFPYVKLLTYSLVPFTIVFILNILIIWRLWKNRGVLDQSLQNPQSQRSARRTQNKVTIMLLSVSLTWLMLTAPFMLWSLVTPQSEDPHTKAKIFLFKAICFLLMYTNHGINFLIYCLTGKRFRQELKEMFCCNRPQYQDTVSTYSRGSKNSTPKYIMIAMKSPKRQSINGHQVVSLTQSTDTV